MAGCEPPSFSLGLDLGLDTEPQVHPEDHRSKTPAPNAPIHGSGLEDGAFGPEVLDLDPETGPEPSRILKRLRRGPSAAANTWSLQQCLDSPSSCRGGDDDIEEFSSQDDDFLRDAPPPLQYQSMCSSSKIPLRGCGVLTTQSSSQKKARRTKQFSDTPASVGLGTGGNLSVLPNLTISPLRRFQLLDSDSDDPSSHNDVSRKVHKTGPSIVEQLSSPEHSVTLREQTRKPSVDVNKNADLWKDFCSPKSFCIPTPAFDEVCQEYFPSLRERNVTQKLSSDGCVNPKEGCLENGSRKDAQVWDSDDPIPPAHHYFLHDDPRVQKLVRNRLPNFSPLGIIKNTGNQQCNASVIDYMRQFCHEESSKQQITRKINATRGSNKSKVSNDEEDLLASRGWMDPKIVSSFGMGEASKQKATTKGKVANRKGRNKPKKSNAEVLHASESWVIPKSSARTPKDAGKQRVHANGDSVGHWYTTPEGRKVYVTKGGEELTGQSAYRQYRKERGAGFRKSKKKTSARKGKS